MDWWVWILLFAIVVLGSLLQKRNTYQQTGGIAPYPFPDHLSPIYWGWPYGFPTWPLPWNGLWPLPYAPLPTPVLPGGLGVFY